MGSRRPRGLPLSMNTQNCCEKCEKRVRDRTPIGGGSSRYIMTGVHLECKRPSCPCHTQNNWEELYEKVTPLVEKMKAKYPTEINIEGLEPALSTDITEIVASLLASQRETLAVEIEVEKLDEVEKILTKILNKLTNEEKVFIIGEFMRNIKLRREGIQTALTDAAAHIRNSK